MQEAERMEAPPDHPFTYQQPTSQFDSNFQSISTQETVRPLASPNITPRRSSLVSPAELPNVSSESTLVLTLDTSMPHLPPPRRSSLDLTMTSLDQNHAQADARSMLSSSVTNTDISAFSTTEHPLSSATTSLSRSAKSGKEGSEERDVALSAIRLQRSLEWEVKQTSRRRRLEKRKMVLLELVETEVAYTEDLRTLVQIYLPQLAALPSISDRTTTLVARNAVDLLDFHAHFASQMVDVLKAENLQYALQHNVDTQIERVSHRLAALFVENVSALWPWDM